MTAGFMHMTSFARSFLKNTCLCLKVDLIKVYIRTLTVHYTHDGKKSASPYIIDLLKLYKTKLKIK